LRIAKAPGTAQKSCTAFSRCSDAFQQLKCHSRRQRRQREKITLHGLHYPATCRCHLLHKPQFPTENRFRNVGPNSLSPIVSVNPFELPQMVPQTFPRRFTSGVRTDSPMSKYCSHGNLLRFSLLCSQQNNRYYHQDLHWVHDSTPAHAKRFSSCPTPSYAALA
jgi:hypothetical protein